MEEEKELTEEEKEQVRDVLGYGGSVPDGKHNVHSFLHNVVTADDTTKLGNLTEPEIGTLSNPIRSFQFLASFSKDIMGKDTLADFFTRQSEIGTSTSLSRNGFLIKQATIQRRELADVSPKEQAKQNKSWFKSKDKKEEETQ